MLDKHWLKQMQLQQSHRWGLVYNVLALLSNHSLSKEPRPPLPTPSTPVLTQWSPVPSSPAHASATITSFSSVSLTFATATSSVTWTPGAYTSSTRTMASSRTVTSARVSIIPPFFPVPFIPVTHISSVSAPLSFTLTLISVYAATWTALSSSWLCATFARLTVRVLPAGILVIAREALLLLITGGNTWPRTSFLRTLLRVCGMKFLTFFDMNFVMNVAIQVLALSVYALRGHCFSLRAGSQFPCNSLSWGRSDAAGWHSVWSTTRILQHVRLRCFSFFFVLINCIHFLAQKIVQ